MHALFILALFIAQDFKIFFMRSLIEMINELRRYRVADQTKQRRLVTVLTKHLRTFASLLYHDLEEL